VEAHGGCILLQEGLLPPAFPLDLSGIPKT
jgi:hypothetical protein